MFDKKLEGLRECFGIQRVEDWQDILPEQVLAVDGIGRAILNHLRLHLSAHGVTLRNDSTPNYWQAHLKTTKLGAIQVSEEDDSVISDFTILVDTQEKHPFQFAGLRTDADEGNRPIIVRTKIETLGATHGDYSLEGYEGKFHIERKSRLDAESTLLSIDDRQERFENTLEYLTGIEVGAVVVECSFGELLAQATVRGKTPLPVVRKQLHRRYMSYAMDYRVPWFFMETPRLAEITVYRIFQRAWRQELMVRKEEMRSSV